MASTAFSLALQQAGLLAIVRCRASLDVLLEVGDALLAVPLPILAVSPGSREPWAAIAELRSRFGRHMLIGGGLLDNGAQLDAALAAGAQFILSSRPDPAAAEACAAAGAAYLPGVRSAAECAAAEAFASTGFLVFPACRVGVEEVAALRRAVGPAVPLVAAGGIAPADITAYRAGGATAIAIRGVLAAKSKWVMGEMIRQVRSLNHDARD
jgi:2-keto-3-deoxy-6-phosphogluconate aldolase